MCMCRTHTYTYHMCICVFHTDIYEYEQLCVCACMLTSFVGTDAACQEVRAVSLSTWHLCLLSVLCFLLHFELRFGPPISQVSLGLASARRSQHSSGGFLHKSVCVCVCAYVSVDATSGSRLARATAHYFRLPPATACCRGSSCCT